MGSKVTIKDVARQAGVVPSTVSRVMSNHPDIAAETRARVQQAIQTLGYRPDRMARSVRKGRTQSVSVLLPHAGSDFYNLLINAIDTTLSDHDYDAALFPLLSERRLNRYRDPDALPYQTDGLIFASLDPDHLYPQGTVPLNIPAVLIDIHNPKYDHVVVNNVQGGRLAAGHLLEQPRDTYVIAVEERHDTPFASGVFRERLAGFKAVYREEGQNLPDAAVLDSEFTWESARATVKRLLDQVKEPVNLFATCDLFAQAALDQMALMNARPGADVRLIGYDDVHWATEHGLTTIRQPIGHMGEIAAEMLLNRLNNPDHPLQSQLLEPALILRQTT